MVHPPPEGLELWSAPGDDARRAWSWWRFAGAPAPGAGKTPVLGLAGLGLDGRTFARMAPLARDRDWVLTNLPNDVTPHRPSMGDLGRWAWDALDGAGHADRRAVLVGSSFGGMTALHAALAEPERCAGLVLLGSAAAWSDLPLRLHLLSRLQPLVPRRPFPSIFGWLMAPPFKFRDPALRQEILRQMRHRTKGHVGTAIHAMRGHDLHARLGDVAAPAVVIHGDRDPVVRYTRARAAADALPNGRFIGLPGGGHLPHVTRAERTLEVIAELLAEVDA